MQQQDTVTSLKAELLRAKGENKALKDGNSSLKEQVEQLQEQLRDKDGLIKKETKKRRARCKAYMVCLVELTVSQAKCKSLEASLHQEPPQVNLLKVEQRRLEDELINKNQLIMSASSKSYLAFFEKLSETENELESVERMWRREEQQL